MSKIKIDLPMKEIEVFCRKWKVQEFALFGSVLRDDFDPRKSDIDVLITFFPNVTWGWNMVDMHEELERIFSRNVDMLEKRVIEKSKNPLRKKEILDTHEVVYEQAA